MVKRFALSVLVCGIALGMASLSARAQDDFGPTILLFTCDRAEVTLDELESGEQTATLAWHIAHVGQGLRVALHTYQGRGWVPIETPDPLPPVGEWSVPLTAPANFGPLTFRVSIVDRAGVILDERTLVIPFDTEWLEALEPVIESFTTPAQSLAASVLASGGARVEVTWVVRDRPPLAALTFSQMLTDNQLQNIELPREHLWIPSSGTGLVAPVLPSGENEVRLRLALIHVISGEVLDEALITLPVIGMALPPTPAPSAEVTDTPPDAPAGPRDLVIQTDCAGGPPGQPPRGWLDGPGIPSPDGLRLVYSANPVGAAQLIIANANGSGQVAVPAPGSDLPLGIRPRWSPDSQRIAFAILTLSPPGGTIYVVQADGTDLRRIASYAGPFDDLAWSDDGQQLFYTSGEVSGSGDDQRIEGYQVYAIAADGLGSPAVYADGCAIYQRAAP
ncbi:MAG: hypothetical protein OZ934_08185 [Anaerolineae bacterium]|nr:hypothetical protein [Anaerolineae bacterium]